MKSYASELRETINSWSAAYIRFETGRLREDYRAYAFVEDEDDKTFYQLALTNMDSICYLGCGGRSGVFVVCRKLTSEQKAEGNLFFVDRDTEMEPFEIKDEVLRTAYYSWESHVCDPQYVGWLLQRRLEKNLSKVEETEVTDGWKTTVLAFKTLLDRHTALCRTAFLLETSLDMSKIQLAKGAQTNGASLVPDANVSDWFKDQVKLALEKGALKEDIEQLVAWYNELDTFKTCQGKALFALLRAFVTATMKRLSRTFRGEFNSSTAWLSAMPWSDSRLDYVREYAVGRLKPE